jgi:hypothetical protein
MEYEKSDLIQKCSDIAQNDAEKQQKQRGT